MSLWTMLFREIAYRRLNALTGLLGVVCAASLLVGVLVSLEIHATRSESIVREKEAATRAGMQALQSDVKNAMHRLGYNAILLPKDQPLGDWYADDYASKTMPEAWSSRLEETDHLVDRFLPRLRKKITWAEHKWTVIVVGVGDERILDTSICSDAPLVHAIPIGGCVVGYELHHALDLHPGDVISVLGTEFEIATCEKELGTKDDITLWLNLADAQQLAGQPEEINEILLVEHLSVWGNLAEVQRQIAGVLPECQVVEIASETLSRAHARVKVVDEAKVAIQQEHERKAMLQAERKRIVKSFVPLGILVCAVWVGTAMFLNVRDRSQEIGVLMAQGFRERAVRLLILSKAALQGVTGGTIGFALGAAAAIGWEEPGAVIAALGGATGVKYLGLAVAISTGACLMGSWLPASTAVRMDPAVVLRQE